MSLIKKIMIPEQGEAVPYDIQAVSLTTGATVEATPESSSNDTTVATTAFVKNALSSFAPEYEPTPGTSTGTLVFGSNQVDDGTLII